MNNNFTQTHPGKRRFAAKLRGLAMLLGGLVLTAGNTFAEGTREISNNDANTNSALLVYQSRGSGPFLSNLQENRIKIRIANFNTERIHYGFKWRDYNGTMADPSGPEVGSNVWMRIYDPNGNEVTAARQRFNSTTAGYIANFTQGTNGPNILGVTTGYNPLTFTPTMNGEYSMVFYKVTTATDPESVAGSASQFFRSSFWDITVASSTEKFTGRVFSQNWGLVALTSSEAVNALSKAAPAFYSYSNDSTLIKLGFVSSTSGFAPIAYDIAFTNYGVDTNTTLTWAQSRRSKESGSVNVPLTRGFKTFLNQPSATLYPIAQISGTPAFGAVPITGCPGSNLTANFTMPEAGDVRIVFDIDGAVGYTPGTRDFVLEAFNRPAGPGTITWNGKDGLGNDLAQGTAVKISATYRRGRFNLPIFDAEVNADGMYIQTIAPLSSPSNRLYWDDDSLPATVTSGTCADNALNVTGKGLNNSFVGTVSSLSTPTRAWNGDGNLNNVVPAPSVTRGSVQNDANAAQCDDYGNVRVLNTWGWALEADGQLVNVTFGCFNVTGNVFNDVNGKNNNLIDQSATNPVALPTLYAYMVSSDSVIRAVATVAANGTYSFTNVPGANYNIVVSSTQLAVNAKLNYATQVTLPAGWSNVGEQAGNTVNVGIDATADGILATVLNANKTNMNFGIQRLPVVGTGANTAANPGGTTQVTVPANTFTNTTVSSDFDGGSVSNIRIVSFPTNATTIVINGNSYNSTTWPGGGVLVPTNASGAPTQTITVDPNFDGPGSVVITFKSVDNAGQASTANGTATMTFGANISGQVWNDFSGDATLNGLEKPVSGDKTNNNSGNSVVTTADLFASVVTTSDDKVVASMRLNNDGTYAFTNLPTGVGYKVILTSGTAAPAVNSTLTAGSNTTGWVATGVNVNGTATTANTTNVVDLGTVTTNKVNTNFGIQRLPEVGSGANTAANPGGTTQVTVPANTFTNTTVSSDADGSVSNIRIVSFPTNATTIVINGTSYNSTTWPGGGVLVPTNASGAPTQTITVDPNFDGPGSVVITFKSVDNAGKESTANGTATMTFGANISGQVWNDANGDAVLNGVEKPVSGDKTNNNSGNSVVTTADIFASVVSTSDNKVVASMRLNNDGTYAFTNIPSGVGYKVILTSGTAAPAVNSTLSAGSNTAGWVATGVNVNGTATTANTTNVVDLGTVTTNKVNTNFGIERTPTADAKSYSVSNSSFGYTPPSGSLSAFPTLVGYAYIQMSNAAVGPLTGTDPEDCPSTACSTGSSFRIQSINSRTRLYYNFGGTTGVQEVIAGTSTARIDNFDPSKMVIYTQSGGGTAATPYSFNYSIIDKAGATSPQVAYSITTTTPLPVTLIGFTANADGRNVVLNWSTASENNNKGFAIERSFDAKSWKEVMFEASKGANGNSNEKLDYTTTDKDVTPGNVYYRLKQIDFDGVFNLSEVRMVNIKNSGLSIYPNPASNVVSVLGLAAKHTVSVFDVTGRIMMTAAVDANNNTINVTALPEGVYTVIIKNESGMTSNFKLVKK